jgi:hypothetical protein
MSTVTVTNKSRALTQEELDGFWRNEWVGKVLELIAEKRTIRFLAHKSNYTLIELNAPFGGEWKFSCGDKHLYTYKMSDLIHFIEEIWESGAEVISLTGEASMPRPQRVTSKVEKEG